MEFFGITAFGVTKPIKDLVRQDYQEPAKPPKSILESPNKQLSILEKMREIDIEIGTADGFAYNSIKRLNAMKRKQMRKPVGPMEIYERPGLSSQEIGWWSADPLLKDAKWYRPKKMFPYPSSEMSKYKTEMQKNRSIWVFPGVTYK